MNFQDKNQVEEEKQNDKNEEEEYTEFSLFAGLEKQADKPKFLLMPPAEVFKQIVFKQKEVEVGILFDVVKCAD